MRFWHAVAVIVQALATVALFAIACQSCTKCRPLWPSDNREVGHADPR